MERSRFGRRVVEDGGAGTNLNNSVWSLVYLYSNVSISMHKFDSLASHPYSGTHRITYKQCIDSNVRSFEKLFVTKI